MTTETTQEVRVALDLSFNVSTQHDADALEKIIQRAIQPMFPGRAKHLHELKYAEEAAIYSTKSNEIEWTHLHGKPEKQPAPPRTREALLAELRGHDDRCTALRGELEIHAGGVVLAVHRTGGREVYTVADGLGGAMVEEVHGNYPIDFHTHHRKEFSSEKAARAFADALNDGRTKWPKDTVAWQGSNG